jgi:hypothetical protein
VTLTEAKGLYLDRVGEDAMGLLLANVAVE